MLVKASVRLDGTGCRHEKRKNITADKAGTQAYLGIELFILHS
jgi:hypothetical protein